MSDLAAPRLSEVKQVAPVTKAPPSRNWATALTITPGLLFVCLAYVPLVGLIILSFSERPMTGLPYPLSLEWYEDLFEDPRWVEPVWVSLRLAFAVATVSTVFALILARALGKLRHPGVTLAVFLLPLVVPGLVLGVTLLIYFRIVLNWQLGYWSLFLAHMVWAFPFCLMAMMVVSLKYDHTLSQAARDLGASPWRVFWDIEVPLLRHGIIGGWVFGFLLSFNELPRSIQLRGTTTTLPLFEWGQAASQTSSIPYLFAMSSVFLLITIPVILYFFRRLFRNS